MYFKKEDSETYAITEFPRSQEKLGFVRKLGERKYKLKFIRKEAEIINGEFRDVKIIAKIRMGLLILIPIIIYVFSCYNP